MYKSGDIDRTVLLLGIPELELRTDDRKRTLLHLAAKDGCVEVVSRLVMRDDIDIDCGDEWGDSALHYAAKYGHLDCVSMLVESGADIDARLSSEVTPMMLAAWKGHADVLEYLINMGGDVNALGELKSVDLVDSKL